MGDATHRTAKFLDNETLVSVIDSKSPIATGGGGHFPESEPIHPYPSERALWRAVITQAFQDALGNSQKREAKYEKFKAKAWLLGMSRDFTTVCYYADYDPHYVRRRACEILGNIRSRLPRQKKTMTPPGDTFSAIIPLSLMGVAA